MPHASTRTSNSPWPICGDGTERMETLPLPWYTAAFIVSGTWAMAAFQSEATVCNELSQRFSCPLAVSLQAQHLRDKGHRPDDRLQHDQSPPEPALCVPDRIQ